MEISASLIGDDLVLDVQDARIDAVSAVAFKDKVRSCLVERSGRVVLDLANVHFVDSSGLGAIVATMKMVEPDRAFELRGLRPAVEKVFRLTRMDSIMTIGPPPVGHDADMEKRA